MPLPEEFLMAVRTSTDIEGLIGGYVNLKRTGRNLKGLCPFHAEKTPSFTVYPENGSFYCFGCGIGGDVITFTKKVENLDYIEAVKKLADRAGLKMPSDQYDDGFYRTKKRLIELNREAARFFHFTLMNSNGEKCLSYIKGRGISGETIKRFGIGYAPPEWDAVTKYLLKKGFSNEEISLADLGYKNKFGGVNDRFRDRLMFPILDLQGNVIAFGGRDLSGESKAKYVNTGDTILYKKTNNLFALNLAKNTPGDTLIIGEGYMDIISMHQAGFANAIASCGTALTSEQASLISRYSKSVILAFDSDEAGQKAVKRAIPILRNYGLMIRVLIVTGGKDPDEYIKVNGPAGFKLLIEKAASDVQYLLNNAVAGIDISTPEGKVVYLKKAVPVLAEIDSHLERDAYAGKLSEDTRIDKNSILKEIDLTRLKTEKGEKRKQQNLIFRETTGQNDKLSGERAVSIAAASAEDKLIAYLFDNQQELSYVRSRLMPENMATQFKRRVYEKFIDLYEKIGFVNITGYSADFSEEEYGAVYRMISNGLGIRNSRKDADIWIDIILSEKKKLSEGDIASRTPSELLKMMEELRKNKK